MINILIQGGTVHDGSGSEAKPAPSGHFEVASVAVNPTYTYNPNFAFKGVNADQPFEIAPGPNNPVGIIWINLGKAGSTDPLPYGLHGTGIPAKMVSLQGIGGLRLTNWYIARAARLMPVGTALQWKAK